MGSGMTGMQGKQGMNHFDIPGNVKKDSRECFRRLRRIFEKILGNVPEDSGQCLERFREILLKIPGN